MWEGKFLIFTHCMLLLILFLISINFKNLICKYYFQKSVFPSPTLRASFRRLTFPDGSDFVDVVVLAAIAVAPEVRGAPYDFPDGHGHLLYVTSQGEE